MPRVNWHLSPEAKAIFEAYKSEKGLGQDDAANAMILDIHNASGILTTDKVITINRLTDYCRAYDEIYDTYPESCYEGEAVLEFVLECEGLL